MLREDHYPSFNVVKWQSSDLIGSLKSRLAVTKNDKNIAVSHQTLPSARREKRRGTRLTSTRLRTGNLGVHRNGVLKPCLHVGTSGENTLLCGVSVA